MTHGPCVLGFACARAGAPKRRAFARTWGTRRGRCGWRRSWCSGTRRRRCGGSFKPSCADQLVLFQLGDPMPQNVQRPAKNSVSDRYSHDESTCHCHGPEPGQVGANYHLPRSKGTIGRSCLQRDHLDLIETDRSSSSRDDGAERSNCCEAPEDCGYYPESPRWDALDSLPTLPLAFQIGFRYWHDPEFASGFAVRRVG